VFQPPRDRDAFAAIRATFTRLTERWSGGSRWPPDHVLELERGEDIDVVGQLVSAEFLGHAGNTIARTDQAPRNQPDSEVPRRHPKRLANYCDHRLQNPGNRSSAFGFPHDARPSVAEQLNPFPNRLPRYCAVGAGPNRPIGCECGPRPRSAISSSSLAISPSRTVSPIRPGRRGRPYLAGATTRRRLPFVHSDTSSGARDNRTLPQLPAEIRGQDHFARFSPATQSKPRPVAECLFVHVTRLLGTAGVKRLTVEDRTRLTRRPRLSRPRIVISAHPHCAPLSPGNRIDSSNLRPRSPSSESQVGNALSVGNDRADRPLRSCPRPSRCPWPSLASSPRGETIAGLLRVLDTTGWLALHGGPDTGKTQLAVQLAGTAGGASRLGAFPPGSIDGG